MRACFFGRRQDRSSPLTAEDRPSYEHEDVTEEYSFDELSKGLADGTISRWQALRLMGGVFLGAILGFSFLNDEAWADQQIGGGGGGRRKRRRRRRGGRAASCPPKRRCRASNTCCPRGEICARGGGVCCPPASVCTVGGVPDSCCAGIGTCVDGVCVPF